MGALAKGRSNSSSGSTATSPVSPDETMRARLSLTGGSCACSVLVRVERQFLACANSAHPLSLAGVAERSALGRLRPGWSPLRYRKSCEAVVSQGSGSSCDRHRQHLFKERTKAEILRLSACVPSRCPARAAPGGAGSLSELPSVSVDANIIL